MKLAYFALLVALALSAGIAVSVFVAPSVSDTSTLLKKKEAQKEVITSAPVQQTQQGEPLIATPETLIKVPSGDFKGPTGQPRVNGPSGPPPSE